MLQQMRCSLQVEVPEWYTAGFLPPDKQSSSFERDMAGLHLARSVSEQQETEHAPVLPTLEHWEVLAGGQSLSDCRDTVRASLALSGKEDCCCPKRHADS